MTTVTRQYNQTVARPKPRLPGMRIPRQGIVYKSLGGLGLLVSFFLPAILVNKTQIFPYQTQLFRNVWFQGYLPIVYVFGLTSALVAIMGGFRKAGLPKFMLVLHLVINAFIVLGGGVVLHLALLSPQQDFGIMLLGPALLFWWPLFLQYTLTWFNRQKDFYWKLARINWVGSAICLVFFGFSTLVTMYNGQRSIEYGLITSVVACIFLILGNLRNEARVNYN